MGKFGGDWIKGEGVMANPKNRGMWDFGLQKVDFWDKAPKEGNVQNGNAGDLVKFGGKWSEDKADMAKK